MPKDQRLYMTFPIDFPEHPKVKPLTVAAKWAFVEMNAYSRREELDGKISARLALTMWSPVLLQELVESHPKRPLVLLRRDVYVIRDYAQHQFTTADLADLHKKRSEAGSLGGKAKANARASARGEVKQNVAGIRDQGSGINLLTLGQSSTEVTASVDMTLIIDSVKRFCDRDCSQVDAYRIVGTVLQRAADSGTEVKHAAAYVMGSIQKEPEVFQKLLDDARGTVSGIQTPAACKPHGYPKGTCPTCDLAVAS